MLLTHAADHRQFDVIKALVAGGASIDAIRFDGCTALHVAVSRTFSEPMIELLLSLEARVDLLDLRRRTPLAASRPEYRSLLRAHGAE